MDVLRIHNLSKWEVLQPGIGLSYEVSDARKVRVEFNTEADTRIDAVIGDNATFLAAFKGHQVIEFVAETDVQLLATSDGEVWYFTNEGGDKAFEVPEAKSFVSVMNRRSRNPQLEMMMFKMNQNIENRLAAQKDEYEAMVAKLGHSPDTGEVTENEKPSSNLPTQEGTKVTGGIPEKPAETPAPVKDGSGGTDTGVSTGPTAPAK